MISHSRLARPHENDKPKFSKSPALRAVSRNTRQLTDPKRCCCLHSRWRFKNLLDNIIKHQLTKQNALVCSLEPALLSVLHFDLNISFRARPKSQRDFRETGPWKAYLKRCIFGDRFHCSFKQPRRQRQLQKTIGLMIFNDQNNSSAGASRFLVHFFNVHCTTTK